MCTIPCRPIQNGLCVRRAQATVRIDLVSICLAMAGRRYTQDCPHESDLPAEPESNTRPKRKNPECQNQGACPAVRIDGARISPNNYQGPRLECFAGIVR